MEDRFKFRVWDKKNNKFLDNKPTNNSFIDMSVTNDGILILDFGHIQKMDGGNVERETGQPIIDERLIITDDTRFVIMQYLGCKDKNNKPAFIGDIIKYYIPSRYYDKEYSNIGTFDDMPMIQTHNVPLECYLKKEIVVLKLYPSILEQDSKNNDLILYASPISEFPNEWIDKEALYEAFGSTKKAWTEDEGDLKYLLEEYDLENEEELYKKVTSFEIIGNIYEHKHLLDNKEKNKANKEDKN